MGYRKITILRDIQGERKSSELELIVTFDELKQWVVSGTVLKHLLRYQEVRLVTYRADVMLMPFLTAFLLRILSRGECFIEDKSGFHQAVTGRGVIKLFFCFIADFLERKRTLGRIHDELSSDLEKNVRHSILSGIHVVSGQPAYLRTDLWFGVSSGGSIGHIAGVLNNLAHFTGKPVFLTSDVIPTVREDIETHTIAPEKRFWDFTELPGLFYNTNFYQEAQKILEGRNLSFIYQRYSLNNYTGLKLARIMVSLLCWNTTVRKSGSTATGGSGLSTKHCPNG